MAQRCSKEFRGHIRLGDKDLVVKQIRTKIDEYIEQPDSRRGNFSDQGAFHLRKEDLLYIQYQAFTFGVMGTTGLRQFGAAAHVDGCPETRIAGLHTCRQRH